MTRARSVDNVPGDNVATYYAQRASAGLIITEATFISTQGIGWLDAPGIFSDEQVHGWKKVVDRVHEKGGVIFLQLWHMGRVAHSSYMTAGEKVVSSSAVPYSGNVHPKDGSHAPAETPHALTVEEIKAIMEDYRKAAQNAKRAGFDGVELHAANGYLVDQFLQSTVNKRTDQYGGSIANQTRFMEEAVDALLTVWEPKRVGVRLSPHTKYNGSGTPEFRELFLHAAAQLGKRNIGFIDIIDGGDFHGLGEPLKLADFKKVVPTDVLIIGNGAYTAETAEAAIASNAADAIAFGRPFLANPDLVERFKNGWPLADLPPFDAFFFPDVPKKEKYASGWGYIDFPPYEATKTA